MTMRTAERDGTTFAYLDAGKGDALEASGAVR